jgi:hypothetical protein
MNDNPRTGRILRPIAEIEEETRERACRDRKEYEYRKSLGMIPPTDPVELARWQAEQREEEEETRRFLQRLAEEEAELESIKDSYPPGTVRHNEPRSIHSPVPQPPWKRKLRP